MNDAKIGDMTLDEYDNEVKRRIRRRIVRDALFFMFNPVTAFFGSIIALDLIFHLLGWSE